jgi:hypothetical protein
MKKILTLLVGIAAISVSQAQDFKPAGGEKNLEVQFAPLGGSPISIGGIRYRQFNSANSALRATAFLGYSSKSKVTQDEDNTNGNTAKELKDRDTQFDFAIRPGIEKHFDGTDRLSPYVGAELDIAIRTTSTTKERQQGSEIKKDKRTGKDGFTRFGVNGVAGFDYYFAKHVYVGAELGVGLGIKSPSKIKNKPDGGTETETKVGNTAEFNFGPIVNSFIRLGFLF